MKNKQLAAVLDEMGQMLEIQGANPFKISAYYKASRTIGDLKEDIESVASEGRLKSIPGIGSGIADKVVEYLETGVIAQHNELRGSVAPGLLEMLAIPGMGPRTVSLVHKKSGIDTLAALEKAARGGQLRALPGMGEKKEGVILRGLEFLSQKAGRVSLGVVLSRVEDMIEDLESTSFGDQFCVAGSVRRRRETVGDVDILASSPKPEDLIQAFVRMPWVDRVLVSGETRGSVLIEGPLQVDLRVVPLDSFGAALQYFTGSKAHNVRLREIAKSKGLKVNEYGVFRGEKRVGGENEEDVYRLLGLPPIAPELREDRGEIEAAEDNRLPDLLEMKDLRGDLHVHSRWSDGTGDILEIAREAQRLGYTYVAVTDHSKSLRVAGGVSERGVQRQLDEIRRINTTLKGFRVLSGAEVEIKADGSLDYPNALLEKLDVVIAALHTVGRGQDEAKVTGRVIQALKNPHVRVLAHPTGRLIGLRDAYPVNMEKVLEAAAGNGVVIEINAQPDRLDLDDLGCRRAVELGVKLAISSDAHSPEQMRGLGLGVSVARRGWVRQQDVVNTLPVSHLLRTLR